MKGLIGSSKIEEGGRARLKCAAWRNIEVSVLFAYAGNLVRKYNSSELLHESQQGVISMQLRGDRAQVSPLA